MFDLDFVIRALLGARFYILRLGATTARAKSETFFHELYFRSILGMTIETIRKSEVHLITITSQANEYSQQYRDLVSIAQWQIQ